VRRIQVGAETVTAVGEARYPERKKSTSADILDYYADNAEGFLADKVLDPEYGEA
jgi:hypothetical protein